jgi:superfamily II DNA helicase RecQ
MAVNTTTLAQTPTLLKDIQNGKYCVVVLSPEDFMSPQHLKPILTSDFAKNAIVVVDKAHSISTWGGNFRQAYDKLGKIHSFVPPNVPFVAALATMPPKVLRHVKKSLHFKAGQFKFVNRGNFRPNLKWEVCIMEKRGKRKLEELDFVILVEPTCNKLKRTLVYVNRLAECHVVATHLQTLLLDDLHNKIEFYHAMRSSYDKVCLMKQFMEDKFKILICTKAVGVVCTAFLANRLANNLFARAAISPV